MVRETQKQFNKDRLLTHGVDLLMQQGYHGTGLKQILDNVQIPKGSFYNYFDSKEAFCAEVIPHYIEPFIIRLETYLQNPELDGVSALRLYLNELIVDLENGEFKGGCLLGNLMGEIGDTSELCQNSLRTTLIRYRNLYTSALSRGQSEGLIRKDKSAEKMADLLLNSFQGAMLRMKIEQSIEPLKQCCHDLLDDYFRA